jgi:shikimate kinase / 3-dehydroquinate synthase
MKSVVLTGFMGTGKTTVGRILAERFGLSFLDLDSEIERRTGRSVVQIFKDYGEEHFRRLECDVVQSVAADSDSDSVIATGGGTLVTEANRRVLERGRYLFCLNCHAEHLRQRLTALKDRPLLDSRSWEEVERLFNDRKEMYDRYPQVDTTGRSPEQVAEEIGRLAHLCEVADLTFDTGVCSRIRLEQGLLTRTGSLIVQLDSVSQVVLVTDVTVAGLQICSEMRRSLEDVGFQVQLIVMPPGEQHKTLDRVRQMYEACLESEIDRSAVVVGLGGGVVCDMAGMLAATYLRGLRLVLIPTTLVAQADAAIGGKVGVDFEEAKNLIGSFYPAQLVLIDPDALLTLPVEQISQGLAEIVKVGAMLNPDLFERVEGLQNAGEALECPSIIRTAARAKAEVVEHDPREYGERALLNFGHTVGHALESASHFALPHGSAVGLGMLAETHVAELKGWCSTPLEGRLENSLGRLNLPTRLSGLDQGEVLNHTYRDKKRKGKRIRFAVPTNLGEGAVFDVDESDARVGISRVLGGVA